MRPERRSIRQRRRLRARIDGQTSAFTTDVGAGGFCIQVHRTLPPGTPVRGSIHVDGLEVAFAGSVAWALPGDMRLRIPGRVGIRFLETPAGLPSLLEPAAAPPR